MRMIDLMVGDWVICNHYQDKPFIKQFGVADFAKGEYEFCEPIPLTEEILAKNGFEQKDNLTYVSGQVEIIKNRDNWNVVINKYCVFVDMNIKFVHQLQHLLRLCGIEKEIKL